MAEHFSGKVVLITGAARGIGKNIARAFGQQGTTVIIGDIAVVDGELTAAELRSIGINAQYLKVDLNQANAAADLIQRIMLQHGRLDVLVNNARAGHRLDFFAETEENWQAAMNVMLKAAFFLAQAAVPAMEASGGGCIINISSVLGVLCGYGGCESPGYHMAKAGLMQLTRYLAVNAGKHKVRVNSVAPGFIVQDEHQVRYQQEENAEYREIVEFCHPLEKAGCSDDVAKAVIYLSSPDSAFITGQCITVDGGLTLQEPSSMVFAYSNKG